jgi:GNAT superfamily N-acetyltransferase
VGAFCASADVNSCSQFWIELTSYIAAMVDDVPHSGVPANSVHTGGRSVETDGADESVGNAGSEPSNVEMERGLGGIAFREQIVAHPYVKDYDAIEGEGPERWLGQFDVTNWGLLAAYVDGQRIGGAVIAHDAANVDLLERRTDLAALWDLRVEPAMRRFGVGRALFSAAEVWARERRCTQLQLETQNINVPACRFYLNMNCWLRSIDRFAYPNLPTEIRLLWIKELR